MGGTTMAPRLLVVHDEVEFVDAVVTSLKVAGHQVTAFPDPLAAWDAIEEINVLITRVQFPPGKSNGLALARKARVNRPPTCILFVALPEFQKDVDDLGVFLPMPVNVADVVETVECLLNQGEIPPNARGS
jgi:DNA-binding response OmpR family regulator